MESWLKILVPIALMILGAVIKAKKERVRRSITESNVPPDYFEEYEPIREIRTPLYKTEEAPLFQEGSMGGYTEMPKDDHTEEHINQEVIQKRVDLKNLIIYSELLKPKYLEY